MAVNICAMTRSFLILFFHFFQRRKESNLAPFEVTRIQEGLDGCSKMRVVEVIIIKHTSQFTSWSNLNILQNTSLNANINMVTK